MVIQHKMSGAKGMFYVEQDNNILAELVYTMRGDDQIIIEHTEVGEELRGQDVGYELVHKIVEFARMHGYSILPVCPFAKSIFDKKPDFRDVLA
jgi:predicted GNAT family acetyltransferase